MKLKMMIYSLTPGFLSIFLRIFSFAILLIPASATPQSPLSSGAALYISEGSYLYTEQPVILTITDLPRPQPLRYREAATPQPKVLKSSSTAKASGRSAESKREITFRFIPYGTPSHFCIPGNSTSVAVLEIPLLKLQQKTIPLSFILFISARRDQEKGIHFTSRSFLLKHTTINHFGRPPPGFQS